MLPLLLHWPCKLPTTPAADALQLHATAPGEGSMRGVELELEHRPAQPVGTPAAAPQAARGTATVAARQDEGGAAGGAGHGGDAAAAGIDGTPADEGEEEGGRGEGHEESDGTSDSESYG